jgi:hypothetical protein
MTETEFLHYWMLVAAPTALYLIYVELEGDGELNNRPQGLVRGPIR